MKKDFLKERPWLSFTERSPMWVKLSDENYCLAVEENPPYKESPHWHLCFHGEPIARITAYGVWTSWPKISEKLRLEAEELTREHMFDIIHACGQRAVSETNPNRVY